MEDQKAIAMEAHNTIVTMEQELKLILRQICKLEKKVHFVIIFSSCCFFLQVANFLGQKIVQRFMFNYVLWKMIMFDILEL